MPRDRKSDSEYRAKMNYLEAREHAVKSQSCEDSMLDEWNFPSEDNNYCYCVYYTDPDGFDTDRVCDNCLAAKPDDRKTQARKIKEMLTHIEWLSTLELRLPYFKQLFIYMHSCKELLQSNPRLKEVTLNKIAEFKRDERAAKLRPILNSLELVLEEGPGHQESHP